MVIQTQNAVTAYAEAVLAGDVPVCHWVRLACERHVRDLDHGHERGLRFDAAAAGRIITFYSDLLKHYKGKWAGSPLVLEPWQEFILGSIFGWKQEDGTRRFRIAYNEIPRKNGKSTMAAGVGLFMAFFDGEAGAEVYAAATKRDQAMIVWSAAEAMVRRSASLRRHIKLNARNMHVLETASKFEPLSADYDSADGLNVHGVIIDELHAFKADKMWDILETATGSRTQPLMFCITTAGIDKHSICGQQRDYAERILLGTVEDDTYFAYIATIDEGDDWQEPAVWAKANPNLGVSLSLEYVESKVAKAKSMPARQNAFRRLQLDEWTEQMDRWLDLELWDNGNGSIEMDELRGRPCYAGLDLARVRDLTALELIFPPEAEGERYKVLSFFWCPEENIWERVDRDRVPYDVWVKQGLINTTRGNATDFDAVAEGILDLSGEFDIKEVAYDRTFAGELVNRLMDEGITMVPFGQGFVSMAAPTAELERLLLAEQLQHGGHPILRWMAANVTVEMDPAGNLKPNKRRSTERIDGIVALIMAIGRAVVHIEEDTSSVYEERGITTLGESEESDVTPDDEEATGPDQDIISRRYGREPE